MGIEDRLIAKQARDLADSFVRKGDYYVTIAAAVADANLPVGATFTTRDPAGGNGTGKWTYQKTGTAPFYTSVGRTDKGSDLGNGYTDDAIALPISAAQQAQLDTKTNAADLESTDEGKGGDQVGYRGGGTLAAAVAALLAGIVTPMSPGSPQRLPGADGDWTAGIQWCLDQPAASVFPPIGFAYQTKSPLEIAKGGVCKEIWIQGGATLKAHADFNAGAEAASNLGAVLWARTPPIGSATSYTNGGRIWGAGTIDCNSVALRGVNLRYVRYYAVEDVVILNCPLVGVHIGSNTTPGSVSIENTVNRVRAYTPEWANGVGVIGMNDAASIGIHFENCTDCSTTDCKPVGFRTGGKFSAATEVIGFHPWTIAKYGPMTRAFDLVGPCVVKAGNADTPTTLGVLGGEQAYGIYVRTAASASVIESTRGYLADTADGLTAGVDNDAYFIYCQSNSANLKVTGVSTQSANASKKWIDTLGSSDNSVLLNNIEIVSAFSVDGRFYSNSLNWNLRRAIGANFFPTRTDRTTASGSITLSVSSSSRQRFTAALTADVTVTLPTAPSGMCMEFVIMRASTATGAFNVLVKNSGGTTIATLSAASTRVTVGCDTSGNWAQLASGAV